MFLEYTTASSLLRSDYEGILFGDLLAIFFVSVISSCSGCGFRNDL